MYGLTYSQMHELGHKLSEKLGVSNAHVNAVMEEITREEVRRIAKNEIKESGK